MKQYLLNGVLVTALVGGLVVGTTSTVHAAGPWDEMSTYIERIAQKFGLKKADVQAVVTQVQTEKQVARQAENNELFEARLTVAVKNGKITEAQKALILAKHKELQAQREKDIVAWKNLTPEERRTKMDEQRTALEAWAKQNGIDTKYIYGFGTGRGYGKGLGGERGWMMRK